MYCVAHSDFGYGRVVLCRLGIISSGMMIWSWE